MRNEVRKGINEAKQSDEGATWFFAEIFIVTVVSGFYFSSWWIFGALLICSIILTVYKKTRLILLFLLTLGCGAVGWMIGTWFDSIGASVVLTILGLLVSGGYHIWAYKWLNDN